MQDILNVDLEHKISKPKILTEKLILSKNKTDDLSKIKKLNLWGHKLTDISIVRRMPQLVIVSLSANCISSLEPFSHCHLLQELYLRRNQIVDIRELVHLRHLSQLHTLWIGDNPCCNAAMSCLPGFQNFSAVDLYRATVINSLPQVQFLDDVEINVKERETVEDLCLPSLHSDGLTPDITEDSFEPVCTKEYNSSKYIESSSNSLEASSEDSETTTAADSAGDGGHDLRVSLQTVIDIVSTESLTFSQQFDRSVSRTSASSNTESNPVAMAILQLLPLLDSASLKLVKDEVDARLQSSGF